MVWVTNLRSGVRIFVKGSFDAELPRCEICNLELPGSLTWTIVNGVAVCECGAEYRCYHRDPKGKVMEKEPSCLVPKQLIPKYRVAWQSSEGKEEFHKRAKAISEEWERTHK